MNRTGDESESLGIPLSGVFEGLAETNSKSFETIRRTAHETIWRYGRGNLPLMMVVSGCVAVWDDTFEYKTIDALVFPGQLIGEFELYGFESESLELTSITPTVLLPINQKLRNELKAKTEFDHRMCVSLIDKLRAQNKLLKFRDGPVKGRLARFLDHFVTSEQWRELTDSREDPVTLKRFTINLFFTRRMIEGLLSTEVRSLSVHIKSLMDDGILKVHLFNNITANGIPAITGDQSATSEQFDKRFPQHDYLVFEVTDYPKLARFM